MSSLISRKGSRLAPVLALSLLVLPGGALAKGIRLQYSDRVGEQVRYKMVLDAGASEFEGANRRNSTLKSEMVVSQEVLASKQGVARVRYRGPYPTEQLFTALLECFRYDGADDDPVGRFMDGGDLDWVPAPHESQSLIHFGAPGSLMRVCRTRASV